MMRLNPVCCLAVAGALVLAFPAPVHAVSDTVAGFVGAEVAWVAYDYRADGGSRSRDRLEFTAGTAFLGSTALNVDGMTQLADPETPAEEAATWGYDLMVPIGSGRVTGRDRKISYKANEDTLDAQAYGDFRVGLSFHATDQLKLAARLEFRKKAAKPPIDFGETDTVRIDEAKTKAAFKVLGKNFDRYKGSFKTKVKGVIVGGASDGKAFRGTIKFRLKNGPRSF